MIMTLELMTWMGPAGFLAYLDPGLGSMQLQIIVAALLSATFYLKSSFLQAKGVLGRFWKKSA
jgi:hypothetical protein